MKVWLETLWQDLRYAVRQYRRTPVLVAVAVLSLAVGIGANTAVFTLINAVMLQWLPVADPGQLVLFYDGISTGTYSGTSFHGEIFSYASWLGLRAHRDLFTGLCAFRQGSDRVVMHVAGSSESAPQEPAYAQLVSGNYFDVLGVRAAVGRVLREEDDTLASPAVAVISARCWHGRFRSDASIVGKVVVLNGVAVTVVGVAAEEFFGVRIENPPDYWVALSLQPRILQRESWLEAKDMFWLNMMGRLQPGVTLRAAEAAVNVQLKQVYLDGASAHASAEVRRKIQEVHVALKPGGSGISGLRFLYSQPLHVLMAVVAVVLLIACANIATLLLARASARNREFLSRLALGASRGRLIRQVLTESVLLAVVSAVVGIGFAWWSVKLLIVWMHVSPVVVVRPNLAVLAFTFALSIITGFAFGIVPGIRASGLELRPGVVVRNARFGGAGALIVLQVSLSLVLLLSSALLVRSLFAMTRQQLGFQREHVLVVRIDPRLADYKPAELYPLYRELDERLNSIPGVTAANVARFSPVSGNSSSGNFTIEGITPKAGTEPMVSKVEVGPHFFETLGMPIVFGRGISERDTPASTAVAVVNETFVRMYLPEGNPIGRKLSMGDPFRPPGAEIIGVAKDAKYFDLRENVRPMVFFSVWQPQKGESAYAQELLLRTSRDPLAIAPAVRQALNRISSKLTALEVTTLDHQIDHSMEQQQLIATLCSALGVMALVLVSIGIYGTVAYAVSRRTMELGIRMAIGAQRGAVLWMVLRDSVVLIAGGIALGIPMALLSMRWIRSLLFGVSAADPVAMSVAVILILLLASFAAYLPARRATGIDPMRALKYE